MFNLFQKSKINFMVVGLGNPGDKYRNTRHNAGFMAIDYILKEKNIHSKKVKHHAEIFETTIAQKRVLLVKPLTYMNLSGDAVEEISSYYKIPCENIIIVVDDISLPAGKLRIRRKGSAGGHNGLKDIIFKIGTDTFPSGTSAADAAKGASALYNGTQHHSSGWAENGDSGRGKCCHAEPFPAGKQKALQSV